MGNIFSTDPCDQLAQRLLPLLCGKWKCMYHLEANLEALQKGKQDLNAKRNDLLKRVSKEEERGRQVLVEVKEWLDEVKEIGPKVNRLLDVSVSEIRSLSIDGHCSQNYASSTNDYNQDVAMKVKEVEYLRSKGDFEDVINRAVPPRMVDRPQIQLTVSQEKLLEEAWNSLMNNDVGTMVIYGRGGIGKTVLLTQIKKKFLDNEAAFGLLIFVAVAASDEVESIQEEISKKLGLQWGAETQREKAAEISRVLKGTGYVLLVDGIQRKVDLNEIGVPFPSRGNGCKIVFTTRYQDLCKSKWVNDNVEVKCLSPEESWDLFQKTVGESKLRSHADIPKLARVVASTCRGLPLALDLIGATMSRKSTVREWRYTIHVLASSAAEFPDMVDEFLPILKSVYDNMSGEKMRSCFLYCALFPKKCDIRKKDLVDYWISEGIITKENKKIAAEIQGYEMIVDLVMMGLLVEDESRNCVKMHEMVREMALWIASDFKRDTENFVMVRGKRIKEMPVVKDWRTVRRLSETSTQIENIRNSADSSKLPTVSLQGHANFISKFDDDLGDLKTALEDLEAERADLVGKVNTEEIKEQQRLGEVGRWHSKAKTVLDNTIFSHRDKKILKLEEFGLVHSARVAFNSARVAEATLPVLVEQPTQQIVGLDKQLDSTWSLLMEDGARMLGLYGTEGVGKTTLLTLIKNKFDEVKVESDVVIWLTMSKGNISIQDEIAKRLRLYDYNWRRKNQREKASEILKVLMHRKPRFVLLLDDLMEVVSLSDIGIPLGAKYKIVFTTRSMNVCQRMEGINIQVECLSQEDALALLKQNARRYTLTGQMLAIAEKIVIKCGGLPLALEITGKCLSSKSTEYEWLSLLVALDKSQELLEDKMFGVLKVGYDFLKEESAKLCFQYCALFPVEHKIKQDELIEYWIGESFIDERQGRERAMSQGVQIINTLVGAGLLFKDNQRYLHMHNTIREMALWMVSGIRDGKMFLVKTDAGLRKLPRVNDWTTVSKMSLMNNEIQFILDDAPQIPYEARLTTLFLQNNRLVEIVGKFFMVMSTTLVVLDLSRNFDLTELPEEISMLVALRYLNLSWTNIQYLPSKFGNLSELIHLDLEFTSKLPSIILVSGLLKLQVLRLHRCAAALGISLLKNLERLEKLEILTIDVSELDILLTFLRSRLTRCTKYLCLEGLQVPGLSFEDIFSKLGSLSYLNMYGCVIKESATEREENRSHQSPSPSNQITLSNTWFKDLSAVVLYSCLGLTDLTWLMYATNLKFLRVQDLPNMKEVINEKKAGVVEIEPFQKLQVLHLGDLNELKSIYWSPLSLPSLRKVSITECPKLRKLPLNSMSVVRIDDLLIEVDARWLNGVEWESGAEERFRLAIRTLF